MPTHKPLSKLRGVMEGDAGISAEGGAALDCAGCSRLLRNYDDANNGSRGAQLPLNATSVTSS